MPTYKYKCDYCFKDWEEHHGFNEEPEICPFCEEKNIKKVYDFVSQVPKEQSLESPKKKVGSKTREFIEQARQELKEHRAQLK